MKLINKTHNGQITFCQGHQAFHLEFGNIFLHLTASELSEFRNYVEGIDYKYYLNHNQTTVNKRKLMLNIGPQKVFFVLHAYEFLELRNLLTYRPNNDLELIKNEEIIEKEMIFN